MRIDAGLAAAQGAGNCVIVPSDFEALHKEAKEIFFGALKACDMVSAIYVDAEGNQTEKSSFTEEGRPKEKLRNII